MKRKKKGLWPNMYTKWGGGGIENEVLIEFDYLRVDIIRKW
jgi:hypothetical protein